MMNQSPRETSQTAAKKGQHELLRGLTRFRCGLASSTDFGDAFLAVDVDIIQMYLSPRRGAGYTALHNAGPANQVADSEEAPASALASALASYILFELPKKCVNKTSMVLMPSHADELLNVYTAMQSASAKVLLDGEQRIVAIAQAIAGLQGNSELLNDQVQNLVTVLFGQENPIDELLRLEGLISTEQLVHLERFKLPTGAFLPIVEDDPEYEDRLTHYAKVAGLDLRVLASRNDARPLATRDESKLIADLEALAGLKSVYTKMQIVSGAPRMGNLGRNIDRDLVIDPLSFLPNLFEKVCGETGAKEEINRLIGTIDQLLYPIYERTQRDSDYETWLGQVSRSTSSANTVANDSTPELAADFPEKAISAWNDLTQVLFAGAGDLTMSANVISAKVQEILERNTHARSNESLITNLNQLLITRTEQMHTAATPTFLLQLGSSAVPRNAPPLRLSDLPEVKEFARRIAKRVTRVSGNGFEELLKKVLVDDVTHYARYLLVGMSFAAASLWKNAEWAFDEACKRAPTGPADIITGSEAAYGRAVALRVLSKQPEDISRAQASLKEAKLRANWKASSLKRDIRFESEELSQWLVYRWICSSAPASGLPIFAFNFQFLTEEQTRLPLKTIHDLILELRSEFATTIEPDLLVREYVVQQLLCNLFQAHWLDQYRFAISNDGRKSRLEVFSPVDATVKVLSDKQLVDMADLFKVQCQRLQDDAQNLDLPFNSQLALFVSHLAQLRFLPANLVERSELREMLLAFQVRKATVMQIDGIRYEVMQRLAELFAPPPARAVLIRGRQHAKGNVRRKG